MYRPVGPTHPSFFGNMEKDLARVVREDERIEKIKAVAKWHFRHFSVRQIAEKTGLSPTTVQNYIKLVKDRMQGMEDVDAFIRDVVTRTMEELDRLQEQELKVWDMLDWSSTLVPDYKRSPRDDNADDEGERYVDPVTKEPLMKPRSPGYMIQATAQLQAIIRQRAELLKLIGNKVDLTVNLQFAQKVQIAIMEKMGELDPVKYRELRREIEVMAEQFKMKTGENVALPAGAAPNASEIVVEGVYEEAPVDGE